MFFKNTPPSYQDSTTARSTTSRFPLVNDSGPKSTAAKDANKDDSGEGCSKQLTRAGMTPVNTFQTKNSLLYLHIPYTLSNIFKTKKPYILITLIDTPKMKNTISLT